MAMPRATVCLTFDFDALSVWIGPRGATSPSATSRGEYAVLGVERVLKVLSERGILATFFIPGHTVETYPHSIEAIARGNSAQLGRRCASVRAADGTTDSV